MSLVRITSVKPLPNYILSLTFDDGVQGNICIKDRLFGPMFEPLKDPDFFAQVYLDEFGAVAWPNCADLDTQLLHMKLKQRNIAV
ncbi:hypothetical protein AKN92_07430 [Thiopseudomonas alkaliphila]|nr:hypothetical protein AKN92_07430 [Thiopseudomonas alkaliphila]